MTLAMAPDALAVALNGDAEFGLRARYWSTRIRLGIGERAYFIDIRDGVVSGISGAATGFDAHSIDISAPEDVWEKILAPRPRPFYQDLWSAAFHHGVRFGGDLEDLCAYYGAVRRMCELLRLVNGQVGLER